MKVINFDEKLVNKVSCLHLRAIPWFPSSRYRRSTHYILRVVPITKLNWQIPENQSERQTNQSLQLSVHPPELQSSHLCPVNRVDHRHEECSIHPHHDGM